MNFFFYDYECFGLNPALDRPSQFAGIRTDENFNIIDNPIMFYCKQTNDYIPKPEAVLITKILPQHCNKIGLSEPEFAEKIHSEFSKANTCILGYNNIRYDDEVTRYLFYRNFIDPYAYSWQNNNSRWDLLDLVRACLALRPDGINWVYDENNLPIFKLDLLTKANGIEHTNAHDAMADVYATIAIAKLIKEKQPKLFNYFFKIRHKTELSKIIDIANLTPLVHVSGMFGNKRYNISIIVPIAYHPINKNAIITIDLLNDVENIIDLDSQTLKDRLYTKTELLAVNEKKVGIKLVHLNKSPILADLKVLTEKDQQRLNLDLSYALNNLNKLKNVANIRDKIIDVFNEAKLYSENDNVEASLYDGFFSNADKTNLEIVRVKGLKEPKALANILNELTFTDPRVEKLIFHYRAKHHYKMLSRAEQIKWNKYTHNKIEREALALENNFKLLLDENINNDVNLVLLKNLYEYIQQLLNQ